MCDYVHAWQERECISLSEALILLSLAEEGLPGYIELSWFQLGWSYFSS